MSKPVVIKILGDASNLTKALKVSGGGLKKFGGLAKGIGKGAGLALLAAGAGAIKLGSEYEAMQATLVKGTGATGEALEGLSDQMMRAMGQVPDSGEAVATALADVNTRLALTGDQLGDVTEEFLDFSRLTGGDVSDSVNGISDSLALFNMDAGEAGEAMGDFLRISQATGADVGVLTGLVNKQGASWQTMGFSLEETTAILGTLNKEGVNVRKAGASVEYFTDQMLSAGKDPRAEWEALQEQIQGATTDVEAAAIATGALGPGGLALVSTLRAGTLEIGGLLGEGAGLVASQTAASATFGEKASEMFNRLKAALMPVAGELMDKLAVGLDKAADLFGRLKPEVKEIAEVVIPKLVAAFEFVRAKVVDDILPVLVVALGAVKAAAIAVYEWVVANWDQISDIMVAAFDSIVVAVQWVIDAVEDVVSALGAFGAWVKDNDPVIAALAVVIGSVFVGAMVAATTAVWAKVAALTAQAVAFIAANATLIIVVAALAAFAAAVVWAYQNVDWFRAAVDWMKDALVTAFGWLRDNVPRIIENVIDAFRALPGFVESVPGLLKDAIVGGAAELLFAGVALFNKFMDGIKFVFGMIKDFVFSIPGLLKDAVVGGAGLLYDAGAAIIGRMKDGIVDVFTEIVQYVAGKVEWIGEQVGKVGGFLSSAFGAITDPLGTGASLFGGVDQSDAAQVKAQNDALLAAGAAARAKWMNPGAGGVAGLANGGPLRPGLTLVGERGPELLDIPNGMGGGSVVANQDMPGGGGVVVNVSSNADPYEIGAAVAWSMRRAG